MQLVELVLSGFRRYSTEFRIHISELTTIIGKNDIGKSSLLEALDAFFNGSIDVEDASVPSLSRKVMVGCVFKGAPTTLTLDRGAATSLAGEYLLRSDGNLEIRKYWDLSGSKPKADGTYAFAAVPTEENCSGLLGKKQADLRAAVKRAGIEAQCDLSRNPSMRAALYEHYLTGSLVSLREMEVLLSGSDEGKSIAVALERCLPSYALFKSDRASSDQDKEVQSPMKIAIQRAIASLSGQLNEIAEEISKAAGETAKRTVEQLKASYPELASSLTPKFRPPNWESVFKLDLASDDDVPLNKRGSGVRRLVLLAFFQAEAIRKRLERSDGSRSLSPVIYAVEEPETSQHPDNQKLIVEALKELAGDGEQVILTTHVPALAGLVPIDSVRFVDTDPSTLQPRVRMGGEDVLAEAAKALGIYPTAIAQPVGSGSYPKVAVCVEGPTDEYALRSLASILNQAGELPVNLDLNRIFWVLAGGSTLNAWVEQRYLDALNIPQVYIFDSDRDSSEGVIKQETARLAALLLDRTNCSAFILRKREIENYLHPAAITRMMSGVGDFSALVSDHDYCDMCAEFDTHVLQLCHAGKIRLLPIDHSGQPIPIRRGKAKQIMCAYIMPTMSVEELKERSLYVDENGMKQCEISGWFSHIAALMDA